MGSVVAGYNAQIEIARMVEQYGDSLLRMCYLYLRDVYLAQDAVQETFIKAYRAYNQYRDMGTEKAWVTRIAINTCKDMQRNGWFRFVDRSKTLDDIPTPREEFQPGDRTLTEAVMNLPPKLREVIILYYFQEVTVSEMVGILGLASRSVYARLEKARKVLENKLRGWHFNE